MVKQEIWGYLLTHYAISALICAAATAMVTAGIYTAIQAWNGLPFPLILTQSPGTRVLPLSLWTFEGELTIDVPAGLAAGLGR
jgi:ABC-type glycerol-3-phosphate transport system permease component